MIVSVVDLRYVFEKSVFVCLTCAPFDQFARSVDEPCVVISCLPDRPKLWATKTLYYYIGFYTRLTRGHVEPAQLTPSIAPPLPYETHPAQRLSITLVND